MEKVSLYHLLRDVASVYADRPLYWVRQEDGDFRGISYQDWYENLKNLSVFLIDLGMQKGTRRDSFVIIDTNGLFVLSPWSRSDVWMFLAVATPR